MTFEFNFLKMNRSFVILIHIGFWLCYMILVIIVLAMKFGSEPNVSEARILTSIQIIAFFAFVPSLIAFYGFYFFVFPKNFQKKNLLLSFVYGLFISIIAGSIGLRILTWSLGDNCFENQNEVTPSGIILFMSFIAFITGVVSLVIKGFITWFDEIKLKENLQEKNHEMELALVKSQLDPHFMFNTINNIDVLILKDSVVASDYLNKLSDIMRFMLFETKTDSILLSKEILYIEKYIELQKIRTANLNYVTYSIDGSPKNYMIAPMVFIPFIENAFKHTTNKKLDKAIIINILITGETVELNCINKFNAKAPLKQEDGGVGNDLIMKRLQLIYPGNHTLKINNQDNLYSVHLIIKHGKI
jgi:two-component system, LytTR family, sensor kinase